MASKLSISKTRLGPGFLHVASYTGATFASGTWYLPLDGNFPGNAGAAGQVGWTIESYAQVVAKKRYLLRHLHATTLTVGASTTATLRLRINGQYGNSRLDISASNTGYRDLVNSDYINVGDRICLEMKVTGANTIAINVMGNILHQLLNQAEVPSWLSILPSDEPAPDVPAGVTAYGTCFGTGTTGGLTEAPWQVTARQAFRLGQLQAVFTLNTLSGQYDSVLRKNGATTPNSRLVIPAGVSGWLEESGIDDYAVGDKYAFSAIVQAGTGVAKASYGMFIGYAWSRPHAIFLRTALNFNLIRAMPLAGEAHAASLSVAAAAALQSVATSVPYRFSHLHVSPITNTCNGNTVITLLSGTSNTALTATVPAGSTTVVEDTTHSVDYLVPATDIASIKIDTTASSSGAFGPAVITIIGTPLWEAVVWP